MWSTFSLLSRVIPTNPKYLGPQNCWPDILSEVEDFPGFKDFLQHLFCAGPPDPYDQTLQLVNAWQLSWQSFAESTITWFIPSIVSISDPS